MNSCMRCGIKLQHNYLVTVLRVAKEKTERLRVCLKCKDILSKQGPGPDKIALSQEPVPDKIDKAAAKQESVPDKIVKSGKSASVSELPQK